MTTNINERPPRDVALRIISALRSGSNLLESVSLFSAGRDSVVGAADALLEELTISGGSTVRWLRGNYGSGKTHMFARIREAAHARNWVASYVVISGRGSGCELHRFEEVYAAIVRNCAVPRSRIGEETLGANGWEELLDGWVHAVKAQAGVRGNSDVATMKVRDALATTMSGLRAKYGIGGAYGAALNEFANATLDADAERRELMLAWFQGDDVLKRSTSTRQELKRIGIQEAITRRNAKVMLRNMSAFLRYRGFDGLLILFDEVENVLRLTPSARRAAYTIARELIDNVDALHGMTRTLLYFSGTPDLFDREKGVADYEALASRVMLAASTGTPNPAAMVVDLEAFPITARALMSVAGRIADIYKVAYPAKIADTNSVLEECKATLNRGVLPSFRLWVRTVVDHLDRNSG
jgi:adenosylhomocysteinase